MRSPVLIDGRNALDPAVMTRARVHVRGHRAHPGARAGVTQRVVMPGGHPGGRRGPPPAPAHRHPAQADDAAGGPALRGPPDRPAAPPRHRATSCSRAATGPDALEAHFGDGSAHGHARCATWSTRSRSAPPAPSRTPRGCSTATPFLVLNGDILTDLDLGAMIARHARDRAPWARWRSRRWRTPARSAWCACTTTRSVEAFVEKPSREELRPGEPFRINAGTYLLEPSAVESIPAGRACSIEREIFPQLAAGGRLFGFPSAAYWRDIGTPASYLAAHHDVLSGAVVTESPVPGRPTSDPGRASARGASVDPPLQPRRRRRRGVVGDRGGQRRGRGGPHRRRGRPDRRHPGRRRTGRARARSHRRGGGGGRRRDIAAGVSVDGSEPIPTGASVG